MPAGNILPISGIKVKILGKERSLRYTMRALAWLADRHGNINSVVNIFTAMQADTMSAHDLHALADFVCAGLDDKEITPEYIEDNLDIADVLEILPKLVNAFMQGMGATAKKGKDLNPRKA